MKTFKKALAVVLCVVMTLTAAPLSGFVGLELPEFSLFGMKAEAASYSGKCGDNLTWSLDTATGKLVISGTGDMYNWGFYASVPWYSYRSSIKTVVIGDSVTSIGDWAFFICTGLTSVYYTGDIAGWCSIEFSGSYSNPIYYAKNLYIDNEKLEDLVIPDSVTSIGDRAFDGCTSLTSVKIPDSVTSIGDWAFDGCTGLISVTIPDSVTGIGYRVFADCTGLRSVTIGNSVTSIGDRAFDGCTGLRSVTIGNSVTSIGDYAFYNCTGLTSVTIPDSVTSIGHYAFENCTSLTSVTIGNGVKSIGCGAFENCKSLTSVEIPDSVTSIGYGAFENCTGITSVYYTGDIAGWCSIEFGGYGSNPMFYAKNLYIDNEKLEELVIPDSVTSIGNYAFYGCTGLTSVTIPDSVTSIGDDAFYKCTGLTSVYYTGDIAGWCSIKFGYGSSNPIYHAKNLYIDNQKVEELVIPDSVTSIGHGAFEGCKSLTSVTIPDSVTSIGEYAFAWCTGLTSVTIPDSVTSIGHGAFDGCTGLTSVTIGNSVTSIGDEAFYYCKSLTSVTIGNSVKSIGNGAFRGCTSLTDVYYNGTIREWNKITIDGNNTYLTGATRHYAYYYINWKINGDTTESRVKVGESIVPPVNTEVIGYSFDGWDKEIPDLMPESDLAFTAQYSPITYYADFVIDGETIASIPYTVETESIEEPLLTEKAEKPGYTYGWEKYELTPGGITVNAAYTANPHTVTWVIDGEEKIVDDYGYGDEIVKPADPEKEGHTFTGWDKEIASTVPDEDLVYTATWKKNSYTVKWNIDGVITEETYEYGDEITVPENPSKDGVFFIGWGAVVPETMPGKNLEFTAQWNKTNFEYEKDENGNLTITGAKNAVGDVEIPDNINGYPVTAIAEAAFAGSDITSVTIPEGVETIGECAFAYCENLKAVNIPASVSKLGETAFVGSTNIEKIDISADNESYATDEYGVIYNKDFTLLIYAPAKSVGEAYTMRSTTASACELSFADCTDFALTLSDGFSADSSGMFFDILSVTGFVTGKNSVNYKAIDGVLYNKAVTTLIKYPVDSKRDLLIPPASVEHIADEYAFVTPEVEKSVIALFGLDYDSNTFANMYREPEYLTVHIDSFYDFDSESHVFLMMGPSHVCFGDTTKSENDQLNEIADNAIANIESQWEEKKDELTPGSIEYYYNEALVLGYVDLITSYIDCYNDHTRLHKYAQVVETKDPTCAVDGYVNYDCDCGYKFTDVITAPGHDYESVVTNVTCTTDGYTTHTCSVCKDTYTDSVVKAEGHKYDSVVTPNTCTKDGYTTHTCSVCEDTYTDSETKATGHSHESKVTKEPTCTNTGIRTFTCHCGDSYTEVIKANGHTKGEWAYIGGKEYAKSCTVCGDKLESKIVTVDMFFNSENVNKKQVLNKSTATVTATVTDNFVNDLVFASSDNSTVSVDANGNVVANNIGKATITVTIKGTAISDSIEVEVLPRDFTVTWNVNGKQTKQTVKEEAKFTPNVNTTLKGYKFIGWDKAVPTTMPAENLTFTAQYELIVKQLKIKNPSTSTINYGETLVMHADFGGVELPEGWTIQWTVEGAGFNMAPAADGLTCKMTSVANGNATVKATLVDENGEAVLDANGNEMSDSKQLTSKAGFWQKFVSFFKKIFGISRVILQSI